MDNMVAATSQHILRELGGPSNITSLTHCATRLRFQLEDVSLVDTDRIDEDPAVLGVVRQGASGVQVIMGGGVAEYYQAILREPGGEHLRDKSESSRASAQRAIPGVAGTPADADAGSEKKYGGIRAKFNGVDYAFEFLSDTFRPVLWALLGASLIITLLVLLDTFGIQDFRQELTEQPPEYQLAHAMWRSVFYFLPVMVGATAARKLGANEWVGAAIPAALFTPEFLGLKDVAREVPTAIEGQVNYVVDVFGLPMYIQDYGGQVFPPIFAAIILYFLEKGLKRVIPGAVHMVFVPFFSLLIMIPLTALLVGPFGVGLGNGIAHLLGWINGVSPFILAVIIPLLYPFLVPLGLHWPLNAIMIVNISTLGFDFIQGPMGTWNFACFGVITGVMILSWREGNTKMRQLSFGGMMAGLLGGISEPSLYGVLLRYRRSYYRLLPGCLVGGIITGFFNVKAYAFVFTSLLTVFAMDPLPGYVIGIAAAFFTSMALVLVFDYRTAEEKAQMRAQVEAERQAASDAEERRIDAASAASVASVSGSAASANAASAIGAAPEANLAPETDAASEIAAEPAPRSAAEASAENAEKDARAGSDTAQGLVAEGGGTAAKPTRITAPLDGKVVKLSDVPDPAFASTAVGKGVAIDPTGGVVVAPAAGEVMVAFPTGHAVGLKLDSGVQLLIHIGLDTVNMKGEGFKLKVVKGQRVTAGDELVSFDRATIEKAGYSALTPVLVTNRKRFGAIEVINKADAVARGDELLEIAPKKP